ncbi:uncharacterized protein LOC134265592 [Saccostrea cucullata]|uniref:uncharacterized protein LOC134265592 n=1 Tax=Saccostrea cuccullata TaxID=36930 RepID=UPI002ED03FB9
MDARQIQGAISEEVNRVVSRQQSELLDNLKDMMDSRLTAFQQNIQQISTSQISKIEENLNEHYVFRKKGNENQYKHEAKVLTKLKEAREHLNSDDGVDLAKSSINEGIELVKSRQKVIKLADSSQLGWRVVQEYQANPIADDSDDEKKMYRAQMRAERKVFNGKKRSRFEPYQKKPATVTRMETDEKSTGSGKPGRCFDCGAKGHWSRDCTKKDDKTNKISENLDNFLSNSNFAHFVDMKNKKSPVGRLRSQYDEWEKIGAGKTILDVIKSGYRIPFKTNPVAVELNNNRSARDEPDFVTGEIKNLVEKGCVSRVSEKPTVVNPLTVAKNKSGKPRLVLDCRHINPHLHKFKFRYEDAITAKEMLKIGDFMFTFDLKSAYHHLEICEEHRQYLGFSWKENGKVSYFVFNVLPFGISTAGYIFSKVLREPVKCLRSEGTKIITYLDDGIAAGRNFDEASKASISIKNLFQNLGFLFAEEKCNWVPSQNCLWLGLQWNTEKGQVYISGDRIQRLNSCLDALHCEVQKNVLYFHVKFLAKIVGQVISMKVVFGDIVRMKTRYLYYCISSKASWEAQVKISTEALKEIEFWRRNVSTLNENGCSIDLVSASDVCHLYLYCDASDVGFGGYFESLNERDENVFMGSVVGNWTEEETIQSSTWRELETVKRVMKSKVNIIENSKLKVISDCKNVSKIMQVGSKKPYLQIIANQIFDTCCENSVRVCNVWKPRNENKRADFLSRVTDMDDWSVRDEVFDIYEKLWGVHTVDRFSTHYNKKCERFNSKYWCPGTEAIDAFTQVWVSENNWLVPPPIFIPRVINKMVAEKASGTLIIPEWKSSPFWPLIFEGNVFKHFVKFYDYLPDEKLITHGKSNKSVFAKFPLKFKMLVLRIQF